MLTKELKQKAETIRQELAPKFRKAGKLADIWAKSSKESRHADDVARFWLYVGTDSEWTAGDTMTEKEKEEARTAKREKPNSRNAWHEKIETIYKKETDARNNERAAWFNYKNYLYYICECLGALVDPIAWQINNTRGAHFADLCDIINPTTPKDYHPHTVTTHIYISSIWNDSISAEIHASGGGACGANAKIYYYFAKAETKTKEPKEPQKMTTAQYVKHLAALKQYEEKAKELYNEQHKKAKEWGMLDACELLKYPDTERQR